MTRCKEIARGRDFCRGRTIGFQPVYGARLFIPALGTRAVNAVAVGTGTVLIA